jgi:hypothetical protein
VELAAVIDSHADWWQFPGEESVRGFLGTGPLFIVGDQPSTSPWDAWHPNRRAFYDLLARIGASNAHLTDLYKRRGRSGALKRGLPPDFRVHLEFLRKELDIVRPTRVVALGKHAYDLLEQHVPETRSILGWMWHFAYAVRYDKLSEWELNARSAISGGKIGPGAKAPTLTALASEPKPAAHPGSPAIGMRPTSQRAVMRELFVRHRGNPEHIIVAYAAAEYGGEVPRASNRSGLKPAEYAKALLSDGLKKGWLR